MARGVFSTSNYLSRADAVLTAEPLTLACWFYPTDFTLTQVMMSLSNNAATGHFQIYQSTAAKQVIYAQKQKDAAGAPAYAVSTDGPNGVSAWCHAAGVFVTDTERYAYFNGGNVGSDATSMIDPTVDFQAVGVNRKSTITLPFLGYIAEVGIWTVALSAAEILALQTKSPMAVQRANLVRYWRCLGNLSPEPDIVGGNDLTMTGAVDAQAHPLVGRYMPPLAQLYRKLRAA